MVTSYYRIVRLPRVPQTIIVFLYRYRESWKQLLHVLESREQRLNAAGEIHRFHRDVADALSRIHDKDAAISDDLGRDLNSVLTLIRKHEGFENDLVALEAQLQVRFGNSQDEKPSIPWSIFVDH